MRQLILIVSSLLFCALTAQAGSYGEEWTRGWEEGYRAQSGDFVLLPLPPLAPLPPLGHDTYEEAFVDGVLAGAEAARCRH
jgi:hypothetical protein